MDVLSEFFERTTLQGRLFFAGAVEGTLVLDKPPGMAFIHVIERGGVDMVQPGLPRVAINEPSVLFCPSTCCYQLHVRDPAGLELICASFQFGRSGQQPFPLGLLETLVFPLAALEQLGPVIATLVNEFRNPAPGRSKALNLLFEYVFVLLVRRAVNQGRITSGLLFALQDGRLGPALLCIHQEPAIQWSVERLADLAKMSRSKFAALFTEVMGMAPMAYVTAWRMKVAQDMMRDGVPIKIVSDAVGYSSQASFSRTFAQQVGLPPGEWLRQAVHEPPPQLSARIYRNWP
ncbi:AraC family transcriptional regulator [Ectopseudomonas hydrolytica]|uniref:AraC family transcriptional regulator n=1 Tax=Ectopseudomonas hydrolytica TaxID=2493633 RepID=A0ABY5AEC7_9GAMM|nr:MULTISPECIES: AraC family transcriptional regulator [Pseudomonas]MDH0095691.1 AraC family transcriptional regulator [Pseudomonas sp. GD04158]USR42090.1 AraC family transcriptional regulator [Pseudomonas hydrolytica]